MEIVGKISAIRSQVPQFDPWLWQDLNICENFLPRAGGTGKATVATATPLFRPILY